MRWRRRVPRVAVCLGVALPLLALVLVEVTLETTQCTAEAPCRYPLTSTLYHLAPVAEGLAFAGILVALVLPRAGAWVAALAAALLGWPAAGDSSIPSLWRLALVLFVAIGVLDAGGRARQVEAAAGWGGPVVPFPLPDGVTRVPGRLPRDEDTRWLAAIVAGLGVIAGGALLAWHLSATAAVRDFEAHALHADAVVSSVADDGYTVTLDVGGRRVEAEPSATYSVGETVPVLVDAADPAHVVLAGEPNDPSWRIGFGGVALVLALLLAARLWARGAARARLLTQGGRSVRLRVGVARAGILLTTVDDERFARPLGAVSDLMPSPVLLPYDPAWDEPGDDDDDVRDEFDHPRPAVGDLSDSELAIWADQEMTEGQNLEDDEFEGDEFDGGWSPPLASRGGQVVTVIGLRRDGEPVALVDGDGDPWVSTAAVRDPWGWRALRGRWGWRALRDRFSGHAPRHRSTGEGMAGHGIEGHGETADARRPATGFGPSSTLGRLALRLMAPVAAPLAYVLAATAYPVAYWMLDGSSELFDLVPIVFAGSTAAQGLVYLARLPDPPLAPRPGGLLHRGMWSDEFLPAHRIASVSAGATSIAVRLVQPDDALALPPQCILPFRQALASEVSPQQAASTVEGWLRTADRVALRGWRRPSLALVPGVLFMLGLLAAWAGPRVGL